MWLAHVVNDLEVLQQRSKRRVCLTESTQQRQRQDGGGCGSDQIERLRDGALVKTG